MNDKKEIRKCQECGNKIITDHIRSESYCSVCGLITDPNHPMGLGINGLVSYMLHHNLYTHIEEIRLITTFQGLRAARLEVAKLEN